MDNNRTDSESRLPFGQRFIDQLTTEAQDAALTFRGPLHTVVADPRSHRLDEDPMDISDLRAVLGGASVVVTRDDSEPIGPTALPVNTLRLGLQGEPALGYAPEPVPPMPVETGAIAPAPSQYPVQEEPPCFNAEPCQRPSSLRELAHALQKHPAGNAVLEQIAQVCGAIPGNIEILQEIEHYLNRPPWEMPGSLLGGGAVVGTGNVSGPSPSTDNAIARYDGTTGTEIQNSPIVIDDSGNMTGVVDLTASGAISANSASLTNPLPHTSGGTGLQQDGTAR